MRLWVIKRYAMQNIFPPKAWVIKADKQNHDLLKIRERICIILIR